MNLSFSDVINIYQAIIDGRMTRGDADRWAYARVNADESSSLIFIEDEDVLRKHLMFIYGIDSQESPGEFIHSDEELNDWLNKAVNQSHSS